MWPYWIFFLVPAAAALMERGRRTPDLGGIRYLLPRGRWLAVLVVLTLLIGFRFEVGGDWHNYIRNFDDAIYRDLTGTFSWDDPGYRLIEDVSVKMDWDIYGVNVLGALVFVYGLVVFCRSLPRPWLALAVAIPYLVITVGMGYTRQAMAIGCAMVGLVALGRQRTTPFVIWLLLASTLHKSAVLLLPIAALAATRRRLWAVAWIGITTGLAYWLILADSVEELRVNYIEAEYQSEGALVRLLMNAVPALLLIMLRRRFAMAEAERKLWTWFAVFSLALLGAYFVSPSSTAVDRVALYMLPLQLVVFSHLPEVLGKQGRGRNIVVGTVLTYYAVVEFVWLNFAVNSKFWIPYRFLPLEVAF